MPAFLHGKNPSKTIHVERRRLAKGETFRPEGPRSHKRIYDPWRTLGGRIRSLLLPIANIPAYPSPRLSRPSLIGLRRSHWENGGGYREDERRVNVACSR